MKLTELLEATRNGRFVRFKTPEDEEAWKPIQDKFKRVLKGLHEILGKTCSVNGYLYRRDRAQSSIRVFAPVKMYPTPEDVNIDIIQKWLTKAFEREGLDVKMGEPTVITDAGDPKLQAHEIEFYFEASPELSDLLANTIAVTAGYQQRKFK